MSRTMLSKAVLVAIMCGLGGVLFADAGDDLMQSIYKNNIKGVQSALNKGLDVNKISDKGGNTPIMAASYKGNVAIMNLLIEKGAKIDEPSDFYKQTPLMSAAESGNIEAVKLLLDKGANIRNTSIENKTVLMFAAMGGNPGTVRFIAEKGINVNAQDKGGWTALMHAAENNKTEAVKELISLKADLNLRSSSTFSRSCKEYSANFYPGYTALSIARVTGRKQVAEILEKAGARSYIEELFNGSDLYKKLGLNKVEIEPASKDEFKKTIGILKQATPNDSQKEQKIKAFDRLSFTDKAWFMIKITYEKKPEKNSFNIAIQDARGANMIKNGYNYTGTARRGNTIIRYMEVYLLETNKPITGKGISAEQSPVTLSVTLFKTNTKNLRLYTDEK